MLITLPTKKCVTTISKGPVLHVKPLQIGRYVSLIALHRNRRTSLRAYTRQHWHTVYYWWRGRCASGSCNGVVVLGTELSHHSVQYFGALGVGLEECVWRYAELQTQNILMDMLE